MRQFERTPVMIYMLRQALHAVLILTLNLMWHRYCRRPPSVSDSQVNFVNVNYLAAVHK